MSDTRTAAERAYDALALSQRSYTQPVAPAAPRADHSQLIKVLEAITPHLDLSHPDFVAADNVPVDQPEPVVLSLAEAQRLALQTWRGTTEINSAGEFRRYPELPQVEIATLHDGTPVMGSFDHDDGPWLASVDWRGISILASYDGSLNVDDGRTHDDIITLEQLHEVAAMVDAGVPEQMFAIGVAWGTQRNAA